VQDWQLYSQDELHCVQDRSLYSQDELHFNRNDVVEKRSCGASSCDAPVAEGVGVASSPDLAAQPNRAPGFSRDVGIAFTFCDEASQLPVAATASFRFTPDGSKFGGEKRVVLVKSAC
jgi:hypothetical protein